ncbi:ABC transporter permease [Thalassobacillus devorans]|uniref:ABC transporter permease n=1 Tax=Thalassobacillus devorans TaxID=279813 RepID=A0ABQ1NW35_9BACI|nr:carbohydrate ABC transporter permease [Thalassobacillus devorans]NIK28712.1 ABC-type glycerol-3-phosphate transport system permease component [Thalassobacillus devorans]GGC84129.1 ABC transporter permease [Thalassobacillus devorans]
MSKKWRNLPTHIGLWGIFIIMLFPIWIMLTTSLQTYEGIFNWPPEWFPEIPQWSNYVNVWGGDYQFSAPFFNSLIIASSTAIITILLAFPAAYGISRFSFFGRNSMLFIVLVTQMFSPIVLIVGLYQLAQNYNLLNSLFGVIITNCALTLPMAVWLLHGYLKSVPETLEQAAAMDGCSRMKGIIKIVMPLSASGIAMAGIYAFIMAWNDLLIPLIFISDSHLRPISLALTDFAGQNIVYWHQMMAASVISTFPIAVMFSFVQKYFIKGFMSGAIKE